jgi:hypothetical protein
VFVKKEEGRRKKEEEREKREKTRNFRFLLAFS